MPTTATRKPSTQLPKRHREAIAANVHERGAPLLDKHIPDWYIKVNTSDLEMRIACRCVFGQLKAEELLDVFAEALNIGNINADELVGYIVPRKVDVWAERGQIIGVLDARKNNAWAFLQEEWLRAIHVRRERDAANG